MWVNGSTIYSANGYNGITAHNFDGSTLTNLATLPLEDHDSYAYAIRGQDGYVYVADIYRGLEVYQLTGTTLTQITAHYEPGIMYRQIWTDGHYIYTGGTNGITAFSFDGTNLTLLDTNSAQGSANNAGLWGDGTYLYEARSGLCAYTFDGSTFTQVACVNPRETYYSTIRSVWGDGTYLYETNYRDGLHIYTFDGSTFTQVATYNNGATPYTYDYYVVGDGHYINTTDNMPPNIGPYGGLYAFTFDGSTVTPAGYINITYSSMSLYSDGHYIYVPSSSYGLYALTFDGTNFTISAHMTAPFRGSPSMVWVNNTNIWLAATGAGVRVLRLVTINPTPLHTGGAGTEGYWPEPPIVTPEKPAPFILVSVTPTSDNPIDKFISWIKEWLISIGVNK